MRNIFDQYEQPENRLTHALASALSHDRSLLRPFLKWLSIDCIPLTSRLHIVEQQVPGEYASLDAKESRGLPDLCIFDDDGWCVLFEMKVQAPVKADQLRRHISTAKRHGYTVENLVVVAVDQPRPGLPNRVSQIQWRELYGWFSRKASDSFWARQMTEYMQVFEIQMIATDYSIRGTITMFDGIRFDKDHPYTYGEAKRLIRLLGDDLQARNDLQNLGVDAKAKRRPAIKALPDGGVWDFLPLKAARNAKQFNECPHLTIDVMPDSCAAIVSIPHAGQRPFLGNLRTYGLKGFHALFGELVASTKVIVERSKNAKPMFYLYQRHFFPRANPVKDGVVEFDMRTCGSVRDLRVKAQPQWVDAAYDMMTHKDSNMQCGFLVRFSYDCPIIRSREAADLFAESWIALSPVLDFALPKP